MKNVSLFCNHRSESCSMGSLELNASQTLVNIRGVYRRRMVVKQQYSIWLPPDIRISWL